MYNLFSVIIAYILLLVMNWHLDCILSMACNSLQGISTCCGMVSSTGCKVDIYSNMGLSGGCKGISGPVPRAPPPLLHWPWCLQGCSSHFFLTPLHCSFHCAVFSLFLNILLQRCHHVGWEAHLCSVVGLLELACACHRAAPAATTLPASGHVNPTRQSV